MRYHRPISPLPLTLLFRFDSFSDVRRLSNSLSLYTRLQNRHVSPILFKFCSVITSSRLITTSRIITTCNVLTCTHVITFARVKTPYYSCLLVSKRIRIITSAYVIICHHVYCMQSLRERPRAQRLWRTRGRGTNETNGPRQQWLMIVHVCLIFLSKMFMIVPCLDFNHSQGVASICVDSPCY